MMRVYMGGIRGGLLTLDACVNARDRETSILTPHKDLTLRRSDELLHIV